MSENKWYKALIGKSNYEAFGIIWSPKRNLTGEQRKRLTEYHQQINSKDKIEREQKLFKEATNPNWWRT